MFRTIFGILFAFALLIAAPLGLYRHARYKSVRDVSITVTMLPDRSVEYNASGEKNTYANLVYTDKGTFENTDSVFPWKQDSSDLYGQLVKGKSYNCEVAGWRAGFLSKYPDLIRCSAL